MNDTDDLAWRKSSRSASAPQCVEVHRTLAEIRDSKNPDGPILHCDIAALVAAVRTDQIG
jgi:hypothetical protein